MVQINIDSVIALKKCNNILKTIYFIVQLLNLLNLVTCIYYYFRCVHLNKSIKIGVLKFILTVTHVSNNNMQHAQRVALNVSAGNFQKLPGFSAAAPSLSSFDR